MKKTNLETLKVNLAFMKKHLTRPEEFPDLIEETAAVVEQFKADRTQTEAPEKTRIRALKRALKDLTDADRVLLATRLSSNSEKEGLTIKSCGLNSKFDHVQPLSDQCVVALFMIKEREARPERCFFSKIAELYNKFTGKEISYNHTSAFVRFCAVAYEQSGLIAGGEAIRDKIRKYVCIFINQPDEDGAENPTNMTLFSYSDKVPPPKKTRGKN
jgi:hypothetical protein